MAGIEWRFNVIQECAGGCGRRLLLAGPVVGAKCPGCGERTAVKPAIRAMGLFDWIFGDNQGGDVGEDYDGGDQRAREMRDQARNQDFYDKFSREKPELRDPREHGEAPRKWWGW